MIYITKSYYGAVIAILLGLAAGVLISAYFIKDILKAKRERADIQGIYWSLNQCPADVDR